MPFDAHTNLAISSVLTPPTPAASGLSLVVAAGEGARFPAAPFNATVWPAGELATPPTAEVVRVTARAGDTLTLLRAQEATGARLIVAGDLIAATITAKTLTDLEAGTNFPLIAVGTNPAQSGLVRLPNAGAVVARNAANSADLALLALHPTLGVQLGAPVSAPAQPAVSVTRTASQSLPNATWTPLAFDTEVSDIGNCFDLASPTRLTAPAQAAGMYLCLGEVTFATNPTGARYVQIMKNDAVGLTIAIAAAFASDVTAIQVRCLTTLAIGDYLSLRAFQASGAALGATGNAQMVKLW